MNSEQRDTALAHLMMNSEQYDTALAHLMMNTDQRDTALAHLSTMDRETRAGMGRKFELCYVMAKESIPFAKYPALLQLEEHHGVDVGSTYRTLDSVSHLLASLL